jgi:hypothetical protein
MQKGHRLVNSLLHSKQCKLFSSAVYQSKIDPSKTIIQKTTKPRERTKNEQLLFGKTFSDHMLVIDWDEVEGWKAPTIIPYGDFSISPASSCLHYGIQVSHYIFIFNISLYFKIFSINKSVLKV